MEKNILNGSLEAHLRNQQRPGLDPNKPVMNKPVPESEQQPTKEQVRAESLLGTIKLPEPERTIPNTIKHVDVEGCDYTINYNQFKHLAVNRPVDRAHVTKLANAIRKKNLLHLNPIVVNRNMEVIDGQHRLAAARQLKTAIYYVVDNAVNQDDIAGMNSVKKNWLLLDYINFYYTKGVPEFVQFRKVCDQYPDYNVSTLLSVCNSEGKRGSKDVIDGRLNIGNIDKADDILSKIEFFKKHFHLAASSRFIEAFLYIFHCKDLYDHDRMVQRVEVSPFLLVPCADKKGYIKMLQSIYNRGVREENIVLFLKR